MDKGGKFYKISMKLWLQDNDTEMYSMHREGRSVAAERFIKTSKDKIYKYKTSISKTLHVNKLIDIVRWVSKWMSEYKWV